ncbi:MAG: polyphosphate kinase 2 [Planctomycetota bacterium]
MTRLLEVPDAVKRARYLEEVRPLHVELVKVQRWVRAEGKRLLVVFEGRDAAGKGGAIRRLVKHLDPRAYRIVALQKPSPRERSQWYFQRYLQHLPAAGELVVFDRSWYNRAGLERVLGFARPDEVDAFLRDAPDLEALLVRDGLLLVKLFFAVGREEQARRLLERATDPLRSWKLTTLDQEAQGRWEDYSAAEAEAFRRTHTPHAPWVWVDADDKRRARVEAIRHLLAVLDYPDKDPDLAPPDPRVVRRLTEEGRVPEVEA